MVFNCLPSAIGVSKKNGYVINSITIPRKPGDNLGGICKLNDTTNNKSITLNVEYNQLDSLLRDKWNSKGDIPNEKGLSFFPGNTNVLVFGLDSYFNTLSKTKGLMPEFVNPKYADETKTTFKSPTRLECMMQDYPQLLTENEKVGFTKYERWFCFSTCKNNLKDGTDRLKKDLLAETSFSCEQDIYSTNIKILREVLGKLEIVHVDEIVEEKVNILGIDIAFGPKIVIFPDFAVTIKDLLEKISGKIIITNRSVLLLESIEGKISNLILDGFLRVNKDTKIEDNLYVENSVKYQFISLKEGEGENYETVRGYRCQKNN
jgi:UDP-sugar pyrophosphorylase